MAVSARVVASLSFVIATSVALGACSNGVTSSFSKRFGPTPKEDIEAGSDGRDKYGRRVYDANQLRADAICPPVEVRGGTESYSVYDKGFDKDPAGLRFQAAISQTARECRIDGDQLLIRVGVAGRVLTGPKGGSGSINVPVRIVVVSDQQDPIYSTLHTVPVTVTPPDVSARFTKVDEGIVVARTGSPNSYRIYVGFDG